jgi:DNA-binding LacI/PurR family transcriptional regulator
VVATMQDVAQRAAVSIKTVSNVLNDRPYVREETRRRVLEAVDELGYRINLSARGLRSGRSGVISLVIPDIRSTYFAELAGAVMDAAEVAHISVIIEQSGGDRDRELDLVHGNRALSVDGVLYSVLGLEESDAHLLADLRTPLVLLGERIFNGPADHVTMRNTEGTRAATEHLIGLGRRRIVAIGAHPGEVIGSAGLRLVGYREALAAAGIAYDPDLVIEVEDWYRLDGGEAMRAFLDRGIPFDGVVAFNDLVALGAMRRMQDAGIQVPEQVAIIGYDDIDDTRYSSPALSSIEPGKREIADVALQFLLDRIANPDAPAAPREHFTDFRLIARGSTVGE